MDTSIDRESVCPACGIVFRPDHFAFPSATRMQLPQVQEIGAEEPLPVMSVDDLLAPWRTSQTDRRFRRLALIPGALVAAGFGLYILAGPTTRQFGLSDKLAGAACFVSGIMFPYATLIYSLPTITALSIGFRKAAGRPSAARRKMNPLDEETTQEGNS
jgi:hypothetical protein